MGVIVCFAPLGFYFVGLSRLHRQPQVVVWSARADFLALLAGLVGFLLCTGLVWVAACDRQVLAALSSQPEQWKVLLSVDRWLGYSILAGYLGLLGLMIGLSWRARSGQLTVYNIEWEPFTKILDETLAELGFTAHRFGYEWSDGRPLVSAEPQWSWDTISVRWLTTEPRLQEEFILTLRQKLARARTADGPIAVWLQTVGVTCLAISFFTILLNFYFLYLIRG
jgi:hypothetical protein